MSPGSEIVPAGRGCVGSIASNGCGCFAFLAGAGLAVALFGAHLMSGWGARVIEKYIGQYVDGTVEVSGVELSWSEPQVARSVTILSPEGRQVLQARLKLPSILDMIGDAEGQRAFLVQILSMQSRVDADGTSDLGRTFKLVADDGRTVARAMQDRVTAFLSDVRRDVSQSSLRVELVINDGRIDDSVSGRGTVDIDELQLVATVDRTGARFDLRECVLLGADLDGETRVELDVHFDFDEDGRLTLTQATVDAPPIPGGVLKTLGVVPRNGAERDSIGPSRRGDVFDFAVARGLTGLAAALAEGASLYGHFGPSDGGGEPRIEVALTTPDGEFNFDAALRDGAFVPLKLESGRAPLYAHFRLGAGAVASFFEALAPQGVVATEGEDDVGWTLESRSFRLPLEASRLVVAAGSGESDVPVTVRLAGWLRTTEISASLRNLGGSAAKVRFDAGEGSREGWDVLDWTHRYTTLDLRGDFPGSMRSVWRTSQAPGGSSILDVTVPGRSLGPADDPVARLDVTLPGMTTALLGTSAELPAELAVLLPSRLHKLVVRGIPLSRFTGTSRGGRFRVAVDVWTDSKIWFEGSFEDGVLRVPSARVDLEIGPEVCDALLERVMPWLAEVEPLDAGSQMRLVLRDFEFKAGSGEFRESGEATIEAAPLRVKLQPSLAEHFVLEDPGAWIEWTPAPIELSLEANIVRYRKVELPLGDEVEPSAMSGRLDREDQVLSLTGLVEGRSLPGEAQGGLLPVEVTISGAPDALRLLVDRDYLRKTLEGLKERVRPGGG